MIILETERLFFRPHEKADLDAYCEMMADPEFRQLSGGKPLLREEAEKSLHSILTGQQRWLRSKPMGLFATILKEEGRYIGRCGVYPHRDEENLVVPGEGALGYYLARPYWGRGLATEAGRAFIQYAFGELRLTRLVAGTHALNHASNRVLVKLGFVLVLSGEASRCSCHDYELRTQSQQTA